VANLHVSNHPSDEIYGFVAAVRDPGFDFTMGNDPWDIVVGPKKQEEIPPFTLSVLLVLSWRNKFLFLFICCFFFNFRLWIVKWCIQLMAPNWPELLSSRRIRESCKLSPLLNPYESDYAGRNMLLSGLMSLSDQSTLLSTTIRDLAELLKK